MSGIVYLRTAAVRNCREDWLMRNSIYVDTYCLILRMQTAFSVRFFLIRDKVKERKYFPWLVPLVVAIKEKISTSWLWEMTASFNGVWI